MTGVKMHELILAAIRNAGGRGITAREICKETGVRHGSIDPYLHTDDPVYEDDGGAGRAIRYCWAGQALRKK